MKQMWDKKILIKLIQDEAKIDVDDNLSDTSENPVQNKVINQAILGGLPDPTEHEGDFLGLDESGNLTWVQAGGTQKYLHFISLSISDENYNLSCNLVFVSTKSTALIASDIANVLYTNGYTAITNKYRVASNMVRVENNNNTLNMKTLVGLYSSNGTSISLIQYNQNNSLSIADNVITISGGSSTIGATPTIQDIIFPL